MVVFGIRVHMEDAKQALLPGREKRGYSKLLSKLQAGSVVGFTPVYSDGSTAATQSFLHAYDRPLPCCGCGMGWCLFLLGFLFPLLWYYGTYVFYKPPGQYDPRERPGLASCAIAALACTVGAFITGVVLLVQFFLSG